MENLTNLNHSNRTKGSQFDQVCSFINSKPIGYIYTCKELRDWCSSVSPERLGYCHGFILYSKCIKRVKRGQYEILAHLPEFVTYNMLEANRGYTKSVLNPNWKKENEPYYFHTTRGLKWFANEPNPYLIAQENAAIEASAKSIITEAEAKVYPKEKRPAEIFSESELISKKTYILAFIEDTEARISRPGGWIARESNWEQIELAKGDLVIIEAELKFRKEERLNPNKKEQIVNILKQGLSASDAADQILNLI